MPWPTEIPPEMAAHPGAAIIQIGVSEDQKAQGTHAVEALIDTIVGGPLDGMGRTQIRIKLEPIDLEALHENPHMWLTFIGTRGTILPFHLQTEEQPTTVVDEQ